jgi:hypothetical protein
MQLVDSSCDNGYEPEGREFKSLRAHHFSIHAFNELNIWGLPDDRKLDASGFVGAILVSTFPCRTPN